MDAFVGGTEGSIEAFYEDAFVAALHPSNIVKLASLYALSLMEDVMTVCS